MIKLLEINDFLSIEHILRDDLDKMNVIGILGSYGNDEGYSNGIGKSAFIEGMYFAITGKHRYKTDIQVIRIGKNRASVRMININDKEKLSIERILEKKKGGRSTSSTAIVKLNDETVASGTDESQKYINEYFSITPEDFINSYYFRQKKYDGFLKETSGGRIRFLQKFFKSYIFEKAREISSKNRNVKLGELKQLEGKIDVIKEQKLRFATKNALESIISKTKKIIFGGVEVEKGIGEKVNLIENEIEKEIKKSADIKIVNEKRKAMIAQIDLIKEDINKVKININQYVRENVKNQKKILEINKELKDINLVKIWKVSDQKKLDGIKDKVDDNVVKVAVNNKRVDLIQSAIDNLKYNICPTCGQEISAEIREEYGKVKKEELSNLKEENKVAQDLISHLNLKIKSLNANKYKRMENNEKRNELENRKKKVQVKLKGNKDMEEILRKQILTHRSQREKLIKKRDSLGTAIFDNSLIDKLKSELKKQANKLDGVRSTIRENEIFLAERKLLYKKLNEIEKRLKGLKKERRELQREISDGFVLEDVYNKCKIEIVSTGLEELEIHANEVISDIGAIQKEIEFKTFKESQKGEVSDSLEIYLIDEKGRRDIDGLSGGEWDTVAYSLRAALARYKYVRMNSKIDFVFLDEIFSALDDNSREELANAVIGLKSQFSQVFIVSHNSELKDAFEYNINLIMGDDFITRLKD